MEAQEQDFSKVVPKPYDWVWFGLAVAAGLGLTSLTVWCLARNQYWSAVVSQVGCLGAVCIAVALWLRSVKRRFSYQWVDLFFQPRSGLCWQVVSINPFLHEVAEEEGEVVVIRVSLSGWGIFPTWGEALRFHKGLGGAFPLPWRIKVTNAAGVKYPANLEVTMISKGKNEVDVIDRIFDWFMSRQRVVIRNVRIGQALQMLAAMSESDDLVSSVILTDEALGDQVARATKLDGRAGNLECLVFQIVDRIGETSRFQQSKKAEELRRWIVGELIRMGLVKSSPGRVRLVELTRHYLEQRPERKRHGKKPVRVENSSVGVSE